MKLTEHTKLRKEKFGTVIFDTLTEKIFITGEIGADILELVEQGKPLAEITDELCEHYDEKKNTIEKDVVEFTDMLKTNKIIDFKEEPQ